MDLEHNKVSKDEAAEALRVMINGVPWIATHIAIVMINGERPHLVHMKIMDSESGVQFEYFVGRIEMIHAWLALEAGSITAEHVSALQIKLNNHKCKAVSVSAFSDADGDWIQMEIECIDGTKQIMAIERQGMIDAYYALRLGIEDLFETAAEVVGGLFKI